MKLWVAIAAVAVLTACSPSGETTASAEEATTAAPNPVAAVRAVYDEYIAERPPQIYPWSADLMEKWEADTTGVKDADPLVMGQDWDFRAADVLLYEPVVNGRAVVQVSFVNFGTPEQLYLDMVLEDGAWKVDNVRDLDPPWNMREAMAEPIEPEE